ncbi:MAG: 4-(cytidine 5'-diphospho)-2-C-methyl-D-erythritol kinase [Elusimicrobia bacterium HGW-Elusimicrobia-4]|nr:MAG: 4-(cytidine 5'-diphospho)-2-C-methyl-D-erythritol kinase [Elusimicrobia bacterium HGW-Elusimicrobia-4]
MKLKANAKINLFLDILGKRKDGYHNIKTIFQEVSLSDYIFIREIKSGVRIFCDNPKVPTDKTNLVYKAATLIKKYSGIKKGVLIKIKKRIPVGAGLGGGSSDAAAVLRGLNKLWNLELTKNQLAKIGKKIGADVPFFLYGGRCLGEGIGDKLTPLKIRKTEWYVLVNPPFEISTKNVYLRLTKTKKTGKIAKCINRLEYVVIPLYPEIKKIKEKLVNYGVEFSLMSGSGSCVFGLAKSKITGIKIKNRLKKDGYVVWLVHSVKT